MKTFFATAIVASVALAGDWIADNTIVNENGQRQFDFPSVPVISWSEVNEDDIMAWASGVESEYNSMNEQWAEAWQSYQDAIAQPWNDFLTKVEELNRA